MVSLSGHFLQKMIFKEKNDIKEKKNDIKEKKNDIYIVIVNNN